MNLAELIRRHQDQTGDSYQDIADKAGLSKAKIGQLALAGRVQNVPRTDTLEKLARALKVPMHVVQDAAFVTAGVVRDTPTTDPLVALIAARLPDLDPADLPVVDAVVVALIQRRHG